jgi:serine/threonine-protein kinase
MNAGSQVGAYRLVRRIGAGGMGEVWEAEHSSLGRRAAVKVLHAAMSSDPDIVVRFFNEARAATAIADPGIVQIFDFGHHDGRAYIVMELLEGEPLDKRLQRAGALPIDVALRITRQIASALQGAHARAIVHRDIKPENIFLARDPEVTGGERAKILDFGIAKLGGDQRSGVRTRTSAILGTPTYMSPEQCRGAGLVDQRSDVYSLGCVLFALITGRPPFEHEGAGELIAMHLREPAPLASSLVAAVPADVDALIARCLVKDPDQRFPSAGELAAALSEVGSGVARSSSPSAMSGTAPVHGAPGAQKTKVLPESASVRAGGTVRLDEERPSGRRHTTLSASAAEVRSPRRRRRAPLLVVLASVAVIGTGAAVALRGKPRIVPVSTGPALAHPETLAPDSRAPTPAAAMPASPPVPAPVPAPVVPGPTHAEPAADPPAPSASTDNPRRAKHKARAKAALVTTRPGHPAGAARSTASSDDDIPQNR